LGQFSRGKNFKIEERLEERKICWLKELFPALMYMKAEWLKG
jgi:hypothetical protein